MVSSINFREDHVQCILGKAHLMDEKFFHVDYLKHSKLHRPVSVIDSTENVITCSARENC